MRTIVTIALLFFFMGAYAQEFFMFTGTYTNNGSKGIYVYTFNAATGEATPVSVAEGITNPSFLSIAPSGKYLYSVSENSSEGGSQRIFLRQGNREAYPNQ